MWALILGAASMSQPIAIARQDLTAAGHRKAASCEKDGSAARRILALALVLEGHNRASSARLCGMDRQTLRDWVHRYNREGLAGLRDRHGGGCGGKLTPAQRAEVAALVEAGSDPARHKVVRWRRVDLRDEIKRRFGVGLHEHSVGKILVSLGYRRLSVRPQHPKSDTAAQEAFKKSFTASLPALIPEVAKGKPLEIWFQDEARVGQQGTLTRIWAKRGTRPRAPRDQRYEWAYLFYSAQSGPAGAQPPLSFCLTPTPRR
jgi:transposase